MRITSNAGMLLLAILLILQGLSGLGILNLGSVGILTPLLALAAGILILIGK